MDENSQFMHNATANWLTKKISIRTNNQKDAAMANTADCTALEGFRSGHQHCCKYPPPTRPPEVMRNRHAAHQLHKLCIFSYIFWIAQVPLYLIMDYG